MWNICRNIWRPGQLIRLFYNTSIRYPGKLIPYKLHIQYECIHQHTWIHIFKNIRKLVNSESNKKRLVNSISRRRPFRAVSNSITWRVSSEDFFVRKYTYSRISQHRVISIYLYVIIYIYTFTHNYVILKCWMNVSFNTSNADKVKEKELNTRIII